MISNKIVGVCFALTGLLAPASVLAEPSSRSISLFYLSAYEGAQGMCPDMSQLPDTTAANRDMLQGDIGKALGIHSTNGAVSEVIEDEPEAAAALWAAGILAMVGADDGCTLLDIILTKHPDVTEALLNQ